MISKLHGRKVEELKVPNKLDCVIELKLTSQPASLPAESEGAASGAPGLVGVASPQIEVVVEAATGWVIA